MSEIRKHPGHPPRPAGAFGLALYQARLRAGLRQIDVAERLGVSENTIARWERGQIVPRLLVQRSVLDALKSYRR